MKMMTLRGLVSMVVLAVLGLGASACNTTKATMDTFVKFTSSTTPGEWFDADGMVKDSQKARLFSAVAFENLEQDMARGQGEYLTSLAVLLKVPAGEQEEFIALTRSRYPLLFASDRRTAENLVMVLTNGKDDPGSNRP